jgi:hypothetical protein
MFLIVKVSFLNALKFCRTLFVVARCVGAKANVLHCVGFERGDAALLILLKRWHFVFHFSVRFLSVVLSFRVAHNSQIYATTTRCKKLLIILY